MRLILASCLLGLLSVSCGDNAASLMGEKLALLDQAKSVLSGINSKETADQAVGSLQKVVEQMKGLEAKFAALGDGGGLLDQVTKEFKPKIDNAVASILPNLTSLMDQFPQLKAVLTDLQNLLKK